MRRRECGGGLRMTDDDASFVRWASRRHSWLWRVAIGRRAFKSKAARDLALRAAVALMRLDRAAWRVGLARR